MATNQLVQCRIEHGARGEGGFSFSHPLRQLEAWQLSEVLDVLAEAATAGSDGYYVVGFVSYDAAPAFDAVFHVPNEKSDVALGPKVPLAWFGVFSSCEALDPRGDARGMQVSDRDVGSKPWSSITDERRHADSVSQIVEAIARGDTYLANYSTRFRRTWNPGESILDLYEQVVSRYDGGYHALIETTDWAVLCGSPELFFETSQGQLTTRPMKGTAPRGRWSQEDRSFAEELGGSEKEQAENVMVVDMMRNDLGRIAITGTVAVPSMFDLERHPSLWQMTSTVTASLREGVGTVEIFEALFPSASVTGAPKIAAMSMVAQLEDAPRGLYCGAVGYMGPDLTGRDRGVARFGVAIRTAVIDKRAKVAEYGSGGGITSGSEPRREWEEVLVKAQSVIEAIPPPLHAAGLIETMGFSPDEGGGTIRNLSDHLDRLKASAAYLGFPQPDGAASSLFEAVTDRTQPLRLRLEFRRDGSFAVTASLGNLENEGTMQRLCVDSDSVDPLDLRLFHKTTSREIYEERARRHRNADDVILVNRRGELTETTRANLAVLLDGHWCTPPLTSGLLPGIERARMLREGTVIERVVTLEDLERSSGIATMSSLRGWRLCVIVAPCSCTTMNA